MHFSIKLRKILLSNWFYGFLLLFAFSFVGLSYLQKENVPFLKKKGIYQGTITSKKEEKTYFLLETKGDPSFLVFLPKENMPKNVGENLVVGSRILFEGKTTRIKDQVYNFYSSSYQKYLARKKIFYEMTPTQFQILEQPNWMENIRKTLYSYLEKFPKTKAYLKTFLLGDTTDLTKTVKDAYQDIGVSHLFALSGMHISLLVGTIYSIFKKKWNPKYSFLGATLFLLFYFFLVKQSPSILRASFFFLFFEGNKLFNLYIKPYQILILIFSLMLFLNPFILEEIAFQYSFTIASCLVLFQNFLSKGSYFKRLLSTSCFSFFVCLPITIKNQFEINFCSILFNVFLVPFVSLLVFPLSLLVVLFPFLEPMLSFCLFLLETISCWGSTFSFSRVCFMKLASWYYIFLFFLFLLSFYQKPCFVLYGLCLLSHALFFPSFKEDRLTMLDVGQADAFLFESKQEALLLDTGGKEGIVVEEQDASFLEKELKARGITSLRIVLSHGDQDHAGNVVFLMRKVKVTSILTNLGNFSITEKAIQKEAKQRNIPFHKAKEGTCFSVGKFQFEQLNQSFRDENQSSSIYLVAYQKNRMLFLGDAPMETERTMLQKYSLPNLLLLKVGHHGSKTSTSDALLKGIKIAVAFISSGRENKYHHPSPIVIERLKQYKIPVFNTQDKGSVQISFPQLEIKTVLS